MNKQLLKKWEKKEGRKTIYIYLFENDIAVGSHYGNTQTDNAGWTDIETFKGGKFHPIIRSYFGEDILEEVLTFIDVGMQKRDKKH